MNAMLWTVPIAVAAVSACTSKDQNPERTRPPDQQGMSGMQIDSMPMGGHMGMGGSSMMAMMRGHMDSMTRMTPERMSGMMAAHDRMMSRMMDGMGADMRGMQMSGDAGWNALVDSVKADLAELPGLEGQALAARVKAHAGRVERLMAMHERMMKGM